MKNKIFFRGDGRTGACCYSCVHCADDPENNKGRLHRYLCNLTGECHMFAGCLCGKYEKDPTLYKMTDIERKLFLNTMGGNNHIEKVVVQAYGWSK